RALGAETEESSLGESLGVADADEDALYAAMDWLLARQGHIEQALARRHLTDGGLILYDVTSTYFEGRQCPLAKFGHSRDGRRDKLQIVFGLLTNGDGCPVAVEVFEGNTGDPKTLLAEITHPDYPGERLVVCKNPLLAEERSRKRGELLAATERELAKIVAATARATRPLRGQARIALQVGTVLGRRKVGKHFTLEIT